ncbi:hypothetical protein D3C86_1643290 [compost metagenome]
MQAPHIRGKSRLIQLFARYLCETLRLLQVQGGYRTGLQVMLGVEKIPSANHDAAITIIRADSDPDILGFGDKPQFAAVRLYSLGPSFL